MARWIAFLALVVLAPRADACTTFLLDDGTRRVVGKSYDWDLGQGMVVVNPRGLRKQALLLDLRSKPAAWTARYSSLTFNQYGREMPNGGMNEAGLVVEVMWLDTSVAAPRDDRPAVTELQWIQLQLDTHATVAEMIAGADKVRIAPVYAKVHYLACDRSGACAAFELVDGKMTVTPTRALTNDTAAASLAALRSSRRTPPGPGSLARFVRASRARLGAKDDPVPAAFGVLKGVSQGEYSRWNIVYDPVALKVWWRTWDDPRVKQLTLAPKGCKSPAKLVDLHVDAEGDVSEHLVEYSGRANRRLIDSSVGAMASIPRVALSMLAGYPDALVCTQ